MTINSLWGVAVIKANSWPQLGFDEIRRGTHFRWVADPTMLMPPPNPQLTGYAHISHAISLSYSNLTFTQSLLQSMYPPPHLHEHLPQVFISTNQGLAAAHNRGY